MRRVSLWLLFALLAACGQRGGDSDAVMRAVNVTVEQARAMDVPVIERSVGRILDPAATLMSSELSARVTWVGVDVGDAVRARQLLARLDDREYRAAVRAAEARIASLTARIPAQRRLVARYRKLAANRFVSPTMLDRAEAELAALEQSRRAARAVLDQARLNLAHTRVRAPADGVIQRRYVSVGDFVRPGAPLLKLVSGGGERRALIVSLPFPETRAERIRAGLPVRLRLPSGGRSVSARVSELAPMVGTGSGAFEARVRIRNPGGWRPGGSVIGEVTVAHRKQAVTVAEASVVLRPKGQVVYVIRRGRAHARVVETGAHPDGRVEIVRGLRVGETVAVDGAAFLSDGARVRVVAGEAGGRKDASGQAGRT